MARRRDGGHHQGTVEAQPEHQVPLVRLDRQRAEERERVSRLPRRTWNMRRRTGITRTSICPGHADYIKNMITGAAQMDGAIL